MTDQVYKEYGKWFMDIAKYVVTGILIGSFFKSFDEPKWIYIVGCVVAILFFIAGTLFLNRKK
jgi:uncharacterized membrane protein YraQ (UPF0718 family)